MTGLTSAHLVCSYMRSALYLCRVTEQVYFASMCLIFVFGGGQPG